MGLAICVVCYNRPHSLSRCLKSIANGFYENDEVDLIISIDYSGKDDVEKVAQNFDWIHGKKILNVHKSNLGLRKHILSCGEYTEMYDGLIVLEDDIYVSPSFYQFAKCCVEKYYYDDSIAGISLYSFRSNYHNWLPFDALRSDSDVYLMQNAQSWGQVWMPRQWKAFMEWYRINSDDFPVLPHLPKSICSWKRSWLKYHTRYCIEENKFFVYPYDSLSTCFSDIGDHTGNPNFLIQVPITCEVKSTYCLDPKVSYDAFFENTVLKDVLALTDGDLCIDLYGEKQNREKCRYWLTRECANFKIIRRYGLRLKPIENNVIMNISGNVILLYDTYVSERNSNEHLMLSDYRFFSNIQLSMKTLISIMKDIIIRRMGMKND